MAQTLHAHMDKQKEIMSRDQSKIKILKAGRKKYNLLPKGSSSQLYQSFQQKPKNMGRYSVIYFKA
jgi:hypothetical protein